MSRRGLLIRLLIFGPLFIYFGFNAIQKCRMEQQAERDMAERKAADEAELKAATTKQPLPGGGSIDVIQLTPEQAERHFGIKQTPETNTNPPPASDAKGPATGAPATPAPASDAKATAPADAEAPATPAPASDAKAN